MPGNSAAGWIGRGCASCSVALGHERRTLSLEILSPSGRCANLMVTEARVSAAATLPASPRCRFPLGSTGYGGWLNLDLNDSCRAVDIVPSVESSIEAEPGANRENHVRLLGKRRSHRIPTRSDLARVEWMHTGHCVTVPRRGGNGACSNSARGSNSSCERPFFMPPPAMIAALFALASSAAARSIYSDHPLDAPSLRDRWAKKPSRHRSPLQSDNVLRHAMHRPRAGGKQRSANACTISQRCRFVVHCRQTLLEQAIALADQTSEPAS